LHKQHTKKERYVNVVGRYEAIGKSFMTFFIRRCIIFFLMFEMAVFFVIYCFGPKSIKTLYDVYHQKATMNQEIVFLKHENDELRRLTKSHRGLFAGERIAREQLLMKRDDETVYFVKQ